MGKRTSHTPGTFSWVDLATVDPAAAKSFYTGLFEWDAEDTDADGTVYTTCRVDGDAVCGLYEMSDDMRAAGVPSSWTSYVTVADANTATARAKELGGDVINDAFDVMDLGRMAVLEDPQGAVFAVWQPRTRVGAERVNDVGCLCMNELSTPDIEATRSFYESLFGWTTELFAMGPDGDAMLLARNGESPNAAFFAAQGDVLAHWRPNFTVESTEAAVERVCTLGGKALVGPLEIPDGSIAIVLDPQGACFSLFAGEVDP